MRISEAINILDRIIAQDTESGRPECVEAEKLGIEALKRIQKRRQLRLSYYMPPLPGETVETDSP